MSQCRLDQAPAGEGQADSFLHMQLVWLSLSDPAHSRAPADEDSVVLVDVADHLQNQLPVALPLHLLVVSPCLDANSSQMVYILPIFKINFIFCV